MREPKQINVISKGPLDLTAMETGFGAQTVMIMPLGAVTVEPFIWQPKMATQRARAILFGLSRNGRRQAQLLKMTTLGLMRVEPFLRQMVRLLAV